MIDPEKMKSLMEQFGNYQETLTKMTEEVANITASGSAGAGDVTVTVNGAREVVSVAISDQLVQKQDKQIIEDLCKTATNNAFEQINAVVAQRQMELMGGGGLSPEMLKPFLDMFTKK